jgi:hypothetical protein
LVIGFIMSYSWSLFCSCVWLFVKLLGEETYLSHQVILVKITCCEVKYFDVKYFLWCEVFWCYILPVMSSVFLRKKKRFIIFDDHTFCDVKYLYFLCLGMFSLWVLWGPVLGLEPWEQPWLMSLAPTNGAIECQGKRKCKTSWRKKNNLSEEKRRLRMTKRKCCYGEIGAIYTLCFILLKIRCYSPHV